MTKRDVNVSAFNGVYVLETIAFLCAFEFVVVFVALIQADRASRRSIERSKDRRRRLLLD